MACEKKVRAGHALPEIRGVTIMAAYKITVKRTDLAKCKGILKFFVDGTVKQETTCWEDPAKLIAAKTYTGCSTTIMAKKQYESVYLPDEQTGKKGIFIHPGSNPGDSDGCIVCARAVVHYIYITVNPHDGKNVTVEVS